MIREKIINILKQEKKLETYKPKDWSLSKHKEWNQLWNFYRKWRSLQIFLKSYLPEESQFWLSFTESEIYNPEEQKNLRRTHDWSEKSKQKYEQYKKEVIKQTRKRPFFIQKESLPKTYYKVINCEDEISREFKRLRITPKKEKIVKMKLIEI